MIDLPRAHPSSSRWCTSRAETRRSLRRSNPLRLPYARRFFVLIVLAMGCRLTPYRDHPAPRFDVERGAPTNIAIVDLWGALNGLPPRDHLGGVLAHTHQRISP